MTIYEEFTVILAVGYDHEKSARRTTVLAQDGIAERYLREFGPEQLAEELGMYNTVLDRSIKRTKYKQNVYLVSALIEITNGEFGDMSEINVGEPMLRASSLYV